MDGKYTPAPWEETENMDGDLIVRMDISHMIVIGNLEDTCSACHANARLIATAPELLKALEDVRQWMQDESNKGKVINGLLFNVVCSTIAKAKGE